MPYFEDGNHTLFYEIKGTGQPLLLIHSALTDSRYWDRQVAEFAERFQVIRFDLYGYGQSKFTEHKAINHVADIHALLAHLKISSAVVAGVSMGAEIALDVALAHPQQVKGLILVGAGLEGYPYPDDSFAWWGAFIAAAQAQDRKEAATIFINGAWSPLNKVDQQWLESIVADYDFQHYTDDTLLWWANDQPPSERLAEVACKTLVIVGEQDAKVLHDVADVLATQIKDAEKVVMKEAAHLVNVQQPDAFNHLVVQFVDGLE
jgi:pimeloyl-ACP methyl ester carboxylesterase